MSDCPSIRPFHMLRSNLRTPWSIHFKFNRVIGIDGLTVCILYSEISTIWWIKSHNSGMKFWNFTKKYTDHKTINSNNYAKFAVNWPRGSQFTARHTKNRLRSNLRTPWSIHFKFNRVIGIDGLTVCILYSEISIFHSRVMGLYSSNCRRFFVCRDELEHLYNIYTIENNIFWEISKDYQFQ
jgi:hypothetical protein